MNIPIIDILAGLGRRLEVLSNCENTYHLPLATGEGTPPSRRRRNCDPESGEVVERAIAANPWFTAADIRRAAANLASDMLSREALTGWLAIYNPEGFNPTTSKNILIIMAGNIPFVGMQDLICVLAAGHRVLVKPSSKDTVLMSWVVSQLLDIAPDLPVTIIQPGEEEGGETRAHPSAKADGNDNKEFSSHRGLKPSEIPVKTDAVIAMGGDEAVAAIGEKYAGIPMLLRGNRSSLAVLDGGAPPTSGELAGLADDVLSCSGLGCRNVSLVFVPRGYDFTELQNVLSHYETSPKHRNNYRQARALLRMNGTPHIDAGSCLLTEDGAFPANVSILNYAFYDTMHEVKDWIEAHAPEIQCVATNTAPSSLFTLHSSLFTQLGRTQRPTLTDYPDGCDTMKFLLSLHKP